MTDYEKFKKLLEYFVTHLRYVTNVIDADNNVVKELIPSVSIGGFKKSGQGYNGGNIQKQISSCESYTLGTICINVNPTNTRSRGCYLNWKGTGFNVLANWVNDDIVALQLASYNSKGNEDWEEYGSPMSLSSLGLFDKQFPNSTLKTFFDNYCKMYKPQMFNNMNIVNLLESSKNLILTGAPGVGKTYKTAEIAVAICDKTFTEFGDRSKVMNKYKELIASGQIAFTTFHQSLDYEEFVEGLKPEVDDEQVTYKVKAGIFKQICIRATKKEVSNFDEQYENFLEDYSQSSFVFKTPFQKKPFDIKISKNRNCVAIPQTEKATEMTVSKDMLQLYIEKGEIIDWKPYTTAIGDYIKEKYKITTEILDNSNKNFVLIIDEINRGNISKIFGELITLLEKDKRKGKDENGEEIISTIEIVLPYSQEKFTVPSNLYIIGTMNTADRSIGAIDYALRRRFAFVSLKADGDLIEDTNAKETFNNVKKLIDARKNPDLDADDIMIGHSYFMKDFDNNLKYQIIPLLQEYDKDGLITLEEKERKALKQGNIPEIK